MDESSAVVGAANSPRDEGNLPVGTSELAVVTSNSTPELVHATPLPKVQLALLLYLQLAEPITSTVIYPFVNQLVRRTGITKGDDGKTGYFVGAIVRMIY